MYNGKITLNYLMGR